MISQKDNICVSVCLCGGNQQHMGMGKSQDNVAIKAELWSIHFLV